MANELLQQIKHRPLLELSAVLRLQGDHIISVWESAVREAMPQLDHLTVEELRDDTMAILDAMADALVSENPHEIKALIERSPNHGRFRFQQQYQLAELLEEDRLLRGILVQEIERNLGRQLDVAESASLHAVIDIMLQHSVVSLVEEQKTQLRAAAEKELKFLSFLSHDLKNNLNRILLQLKGLERTIEKSADAPTAVKTIKAAQSSIMDTVAGMQKFLKREELRQSQAVPYSEVVDLRQVAENVIGQLSDEGLKKDVHTEITISPDTTVIGDRELLTLVLQNLIGNAVKFSSGGTVRVTARRHDSNGKARCEIAVSDHGPGIAPERLKHIFDAFTRGSAHDREGIGLGLTIASQAAKLLHSDLKVESAVGVGSTFSFILPCGGEAPPSPRTPGVKSL